MENRPEQILNPNEEIKKRRAVWRDFIINFNNYKKDGSSISISEYPDLNKLQNYVMNNIELDDPDFFQVPTGEEAMLFIDSLIEEFKK